MESLPNFFSFRAFFPKERDDMIRIVSKEVPLPTIERTQCQNSGAPNDTFLGNDLKWLVMHPGVL